MAILSTVKKFLPYVKTATGYVLYRLSSQAVQMDDGNTLQAAYNSLNSKIVVVKTGRVSISASAKKNATATISYSGFSAKPVVIATPETSWADTQQVTVSSVTESSAKITLYNGSTANTTTSVMYSVIGS